MREHWVRHLWLVLMVALLLGVAWPHTAATQESLPVPPITAISVYAYDPATGEVIMAHQADERVAIGSVTKVATALVANDILPLDQTVVIAGTDMVDPGYSSMGLQPGDTLTVEQLLTGVLVVSGGDAAIALARTAGARLCECNDSEAAVAAFVEAMNTLAADLGLADTQFANVDGADAPDAWSTARDVAHLYQALVDQPTLVAMAAMSSYSFTSVGAGQTPYEGLSTNQLVGQYDLTSAKTGSETNAGGCIVFARTSAGGGTQVIAVLGADLEYDDMWNPVVDARWDDSVSVIEAIDANWTPGQYIADEPVADDAPEAAGIPPFDAETAERRLPVHNDTPDVMDSATAQPGTMTPVVVATVAVGVLVLSAAVSWFHRGSTP